MSKAITVGRLRRKVQFRRATVADDGLRGRETWGNLGGVVWAARDDVSDAERYAAGAVEAVTVARFLVRWSSLSASVTAADRIRHGGRDWNITGIKEVGWKDYLEFTAQVLADPGGQP